MSTRRRTLCSTCFMRAASIAATLALFPGAVFAQSTIAGQVSDETGGVLPGVTVEAASEALIEGSRTAVTDGQGNYSIIELQPGIYTVTFSLQGFSTFVRDEVQIVTGASVPIDAEMAVGSIQETVTVSGASPVVDIQQATQRSVIDRETLDALPTNRTTHTAGMVLPGMKMTGSMVGGAGNTVVQQYITARGKTQIQNTSQVDGMDTRMIRGGGNLPYDNFGMAQEISIETNPTTAETAGGGIRINMIPRDGGNTFSGDVYFSGMNGAWQSDNITDELRDIGATTPTSTEKMIDLNPSFGGPIIRDKLWFFTSARLNRQDLGPAGATFFVDGRPGTEQGINSTATDNISFRITWQATPKNKITTYRDQFWRYQSHFLGNATTDWATAPEIYERGTQYVWPTKWTSAVSNRLLIEAGFQYWGYDNTLFTPQPGVLQDRPALGLPPASQTGPWYASAAQRDLVFGTVNKGFFLGSCCRRYIQPAQVYQASVSYVTGSHSVKAGLTGRWGHEQIQRQEHNASLSQFYLAGNPFGVLVSPDPSNIDQEVNRDVGFYVQDQWTLDRLTVNAGIRVEHFRGGIGATTAAAGRFVPARSVEAFEVFNFTDALPRFSVVYDLFGDAKTALKFSAGRYIGTLGAVPLEAYNPLSTGVELRGWGDTDLTGLNLPTNGDDIAQDNEIRPSANPQFGIRAALQADPNLEREDSWDFSVGVQQEVREGISVTASWYHTREGRLWAKRDVGISPDDFTPFQVANPTGNGEMITLYDLNPGVDIGNIFTVSSPIDERTYHGLRVRVEHAGAAQKRWHHHRWVVYRPPVGGQLRFQRPERFPVLRRDGQPVPGERRGGVDPVPT